MNDMVMEDPVGDGKLVELIYKVIDARKASDRRRISDRLRARVNQILAPQVINELEGRLQEMSSRCPSIATSCLARVTNLWW